MSNQSTVNLNPELIEALLSSLEQLATVCEELLDCILQIKKLINDHDTDNDTDSGVTHAQ